MQHFRKQLAHLHCSVSHKNASQIFLNCLVILKELTKKAAVSGFLVLKSSTTLNKSCYTTYLHTRWWQSPHRNTAELCATMYIFVYVTVSSHTGSMLVSNRR